MHCISSSRSLGALLIVAAMLGCGERDGSPAVRADTQGHDTAIGGTASATPAAETSVDEQPGDVIRRYYQAIAARNFDAAYGLWSDAGRASNQSAREFARGFAHTARVHVTVRDSASIEGAAGSQYATVPVVVDAVQKDGRSQHFAGTYTLRRAMVDGATAEQRQWRIYSADLQLQSLQLSK